MGLEPFGNLTRFRISASLFSVNSGKDISQHIHCILITDYDTKK